MIGSLDIMAGQNYTIWTFFNSAPSYITTIAICCLAFHYDSARDAGRLVSEAGCRTIARCGTIAKSKMNLLKCISNSNDIEPLLRLPPVCISQSANWNFHCRSPALSEPLVK